MLPNYHECEFCSASFVKEANLRKHNCKYKKRFMFVRSTKKGMAAYNYYKKWLTVQGRTIKYVDEHTFIHSTQYNHFMKFIDFAKEQSLPDITEYIKIMTKKKISPQNWCYDGCMDIFFDEYDFNTDPVKHISKSVDTIIRISDALECKPSEIFAELDVKDITLLVKTRKISPWLLLNSRVFKQYLITRATAKDREYIQKFVNPKKWKEIINKNPKIKKTVERIIEEFGL